MLVVLVVMDTCKRCRSCRWRGLYLADSSEGGREFRYRHTRPGSQTPRRDTGGSETMSGEQRTSILQRVRVKCVREGGREGGMKRGQQSP